MKGQSLVSQRNTVVGLAHNLLLNDGTVWVRILPLRKMSEKLFTMKKFLFAFLMVILSGATASAQKYGHLNFGNLITLMPETKDADTQLEAFQKELVAKGEEMASQFQVKYNKFVADVQSGTLSPVQQQEQQQALQKEQQDIINYEQEMQQKITEKRGELLQPIVEKAEKAIGEVAKEAGYTLVFDTSSFNVLLFAQDSDDLLPIVKTKLGLN